MVVTVAGIPYLSRLKSTRRSFCLCPPPWWRIVIAPELLRPPVRCFTVRSGLCGLSVVRSSLTSFVAKRSDGVIGRNDLIGIVFIPLPARLILGCASFLKSVACGYISTSSQPPAVRGCRGIPASSRHLSGEHKPSSSRGDSRRTYHGGAPYP